MGCFRGFSPAAPSQAHESEDESSICRMGDKKCANFPDEKIRLSHEELGFRPAEFKGQRHKEASSPEGFFPPGEDFFFLVTTFACPPSLAGIEKML